MYFLIERKPRFKKIFQFFPCSNKYKKIKGTAVFSITLSDYNLLRKKELKLPFIAHNALFVFEKEDSSFDVLGLAINNTFYGSNTHGYQIYYDKVLRENMEELEFS